MKIENHSPSLMSYQTRKTFIHLRYSNEDLFNEIWEFSVPPLKAYATTTFKPQKGSDPCDSSGLSSILWSRSSALFAQKNKHNLPLYLHNINLQHTSALACRLIKLTLTNVSIWCWEFTGGFTVVSKSIWTHKMPKSHHNSLLFKTMARVIL